MARSKKKADDDALFGSPTFVATSADGTLVRMTVWCSPNDLDLDRGKKLARYAYESRTGKSPPSFSKAHFEQPGTGMVIESYSAVELEDEEAAADHEEEGKRGHPQVI